MQGKVQNRDFHHALTVQNDLCIGCTHCMSVCPTQAIRVRNGKAIIIANRCVDCGECYKACPVSAINVEHDDLEMIFRFPVRVILIPKRAYRPVSEENNGIKHIQCLKGNWIHTYL